MNQNAVLHNLYVLATASYIPSIVVSIINIIYIRNLVIRAPGLKINYAAKKWSESDRYVAAIWVGVIVFMITAAANHAMRNINAVALSIAPALLTIGGTIALSIKHFKLKEEYKKNSKAINILLAVTAVIVSYKASVMTNSYIAEYTHTNASNFPDAQRYITIFASVGIWVYAAVWFSLFAYMAIMLITFIKMVRSDKIAEKESRYIRCLIGDSPYRIGTRKNERNKELLVLLSLILGASMTVSVPLTYVKLLKISSIENFAKDLLVETSFQLSPDICRVTAPKGSLMALLPFKQAAVSIPDDNIKYRFLIIECERSFDKLEPIPK